MPDTVFTGQGLESSAENTSTSRTNDGVANKQGLSRKSLKQSLLDCCIGWPEGSTDIGWFIPHGSLEDIVTPSSILAELELKQQSRGIIPDLALATKYHKLASKLFAVLVLINKASSIGPLFEEGLSDSLLPLIRYFGTGKPARTNVKLTTRSNPVTPIQEMESWNLEEIEAFSREQWSVLAPVFENEGKPRHYSFEDERIMPFTYDEEFEKRIAGSHSEVWKVCIHPSHQKWQNNLGEIQCASEYFAVKRLFSELSFTKEAEVLRAIANKQDSHLANLFATYKLKAQYHFIFQWAPADLLKYWDTVVLPSFTSADVLWMIEQCKGIAEGLSSMHGYKSRAHFETFDPQKEDTRYNQPREISLRHGDIKPRNILWYGNQTSSGKPRGRLVLIDFGLSRLNRRGSRSLAYGQQGSNTHSPPELQQGRPASPKSDIWNLGCVFLEFITWSLLGSAGLLKFREYRSEATYEGNTITDTFYTELDANRAIVRETVIFWISDLRARPRCSRMFNDFLDLVEYRMLLADRDMRIDSLALSRELDLIYKKSLKDREYLLAPVSVNERSETQRATLESVLRAVSLTSLKFLAPRKPRGWDQRPEAVARFIYLDQMANQSSPKPTVGFKLPLDEKEFEELETRERRFWDEWKASYAR